MAVDDPDPELADLSAEEARRHLMRLITRQDIDSHEEIYDELARE